MTRFAPIAIVGRACVLPGVLDPDALWQAVIGGRDLLSQVPAERWRVRPSRILTDASSPAPDRTWSDRGGYVRDFEAQFDASGFDLGADEIRGLDPLFQWVLHTGRAALNDANWSGDRARAGVIIGNLSYPTSEMSRYAESVWLERLGGVLGADAARSVGVDAVGSHDARNRFMSGLPAHLLASGLGLGAGAFALDAACASTLVAIKLACDNLHDGKADLMLAGAVNRADDLFLHAGFAALNALSQSGRSRPFHPGADGLVPAEGACMFALRRLADAEKDGDQILGVIRAVGLSNDGRGRGFLMPSQAGQVRAVRQAYALSGLSPAEVGFVECHATGTSVGDATEIATLHEVFGDRRGGLPIGSFKANAGHLITAAGGAGLLKILGAMEHEALPPTPHLDALHPALAATSLRVVRSAEAWPSEGARRAAVSAFGFGGNNAHLIVEQWRPDAHRVAVTADLAPPKVVVVALGARVADGQSAADFEAALFEGRGRVRDRAGVQSAHADSVTLPLKGLRFPPADLEQTLPQQLLLLAAAREAVADIRLNRERTGVLVGMQCDPEVARHGARWRMIEWGQIWGCSPEWIASARDGFVPLLGAAGVVGAMPNVVANRLNSQLDLCGFSFTVSSEELSGVRALQLARRALEAGELDAALVGAVDVCAEEVHERAAKDVLPAELQPAGDAAVCMVLKRLDDARRDGDRILAVLDEPGGAAAGLELQTSSLVDLFGHAHAASGLVQVAAAVISCARGRAPAGLANGRGTEAFRAQVRVDALGGQQQSVYLSAVEPPLSQVFVSPEPTDGPCLTIAVHRGPPQVPAPEQPSLQAVQHMEPAPALPPVLGQADQPQAAAVLADVVAQASQGSRPLSRPQVAPAAVLAQPGGQVVAVPASTSSVTRLLEVQRAISTAHQQFLTEQATLHNDFLQMRTRVAQALLPQVPDYGAAHVGDPTVIPAGLAPTAAIHAPTVAPPPPTQRDVPPDRGIRGPCFSREQLEVHPGGRISEIFGSEFAYQDEYALQVRMPEPPLLLADRVVGLAAEPGSMGRGTVWSETDVQQDSWFLHRGRVPAGILIECGQADLFLISYLGIDRLNAGKRAYRLLGCELTYHGSAPGVGDTLHYDIHVDGHASHGDVRLFFFHSDCHVGQCPILSVRNGQAGFFSEAELAESAGVLWSAKDEEPVDNPRLDPPRVTCTRRDFDNEQLRAFGDGDVFRCFGPGFERGQTHTQTPTIQAGQMCFIDYIEGLDPTGGPWGRGYARAITAIHADDWFFDGHFKNDPCMPGTLMFEGCLQLMAFYLTALGHTLERDGWRFEPVPEVSYALQCRGQVLPTSKQLVCEIFVEEVWDGPEPTLFAHLLGTVDGQKAFHARHVGLRLVPDWPLATRPELLADHRQIHAVASVDGFEFGYPSLLACAWGKPSDAFGKMYTPFDTTRRVARLPGPPYHFMSRVTQIHGDIGDFKAGAQVEIQYDVPVDAWYFQHNGCATMPYAVLLEAVLQPCGWLASYVGSALTSDNDLAFRNLDGKGTVLRELGPGIGTLRTVSRLTNVSKSGDMIIQSFEVKCFSGQECVYELDTVFGFFPAEALANQIGLPTSAEQRAAVEADSDYCVDLTGAPERYCGRSPRLAEPMLRMLDRITAFDPTGAAAGLGSLRAEKDVDASEWFFKAHFFQDPVQPGSLGIEAMLQLLQFYMLETNMNEGLEGGHFEPIGLGEEMSWKYRGQVVPENRKISVTLEVTERGRDERGAFARADASLWVDAKRIYEAKGLAMRISNSAV